MLMGMILLLAILYGYQNGLNASAGIVSTLISSRALNPRGALVLAAVGVTMGPFLFGVAVASTIGSKLISANASTPLVVTAALSSTLIWTWFTLQLGIPSSASQTLVGSLIGAAWSGYGVHAILISGLSKTMLGLFLSPILGLLVGYFLTRLIRGGSAYATPRINRVFQWGQILISFFMAMTVGANDGQKMMGILVMGLIATGFKNSFEIPLWVIGISALSMGLGTWRGGWQLIRTLAGKFYKIRPIEGFGVQMTASLVLTGAGILGGPVSGSQVITSAIIGAGSADRIQKVRWGEVQRILIGWSVTIPITACLSSLIYRFLGVL